MLINFSVISTPLCNLAIAFTEKNLIHIRFTSQAASRPLTKHPLLLKTIHQLNNYFDDPHFLFDLPLAPAKTDFQARVRDQMKIIPVGSAWTYLKLAMCLNTSPRAIGNACRANDFPLIIPCHRIIASNGFGGFNGEITGKMLDLKMKLLAHEKFSL
jgi:methylated-DNA-[protein]-cysteine S-methyltransferase